ncbi:drug resistance transporter, EmrB/QacA subfamily [Chitinophaga jiangningensis]|uniref:Drug resistance transporter, EmrB/QacA subfamily n=1 Tax=Chitinophaga jiangningensis TaxID=1419482 RepID=A0A1M6ZXF9_9BACT|nr:MFS transporter [Chitinophaga jiangningensis]SHL35106.1 drug resistance transporter, EmrB/QacA subfamily [Chitinophaga jiangningensis]
MESVALNSAAGRWIMISAIMASTMAFIDGTALNVVLPSLQHALDASAAELFWVLNAYMLMLASLILIGGALGDRLGRKRVFMAGIMVFIIGSACCGFSATAAQLIAFRALQGIGGAFMIPGSLSLISATINENERGKAVGTWSAATTFVTMAGPLLGGWLADAGWWRYIFFINVPLGLAALFILWRHVAENRDEEEVEGPIDYPGAVYIAVGLASLTYGFLTMPTAGWQHPKVFITVLVGVVLLIAFIGRESRIPYPMMSLHLFKNRVFLGANLLCFFLYAGLNGAMLFLSLNLVQVQGYSQLQSGLTFLPFSLMMILFSRTMGALADKYGPRLFLTMGPVIAGVGMLLMSTIKETRGFADYFTTYFPGIMIFGAGMAITVSPLTAAVMGAVGKQLAGTASGVNNAVTRIATVFSTAVFGGLAVVFFSAYTQHAISDMGLSAAEQQQVLQQATALGDARVPTGIALQDQIAGIYKAAFISTYGHVLKICGVLGIIAGVLAFIYLKNNTGSDKKYSQ